MAQRSITVDGMLKRNLGLRGSIIPRNYNFRTPNGNFMRAVDVIGKSPERVAQLGPVIDDVRGHEDLVNWLGIKMIEMPPATLTREKITFEQPFYIADILFTNGHLNKLMGLMPDKMAEILGDPMRIYEWSRSFSIASLPGALLSDNILIDDCPLVGVACYQADRIARSLGGALPYPEQWARAVRGKNGDNNFPWGNEKPDSSRLIYGQAGTMPVKSLEAGKSPEGVYDLIGNVLEWTNCDAIRGDYAVGRTSWLSPGISRVFYRPQLITNSSQGFNYIGFRLFRLDEYPTSDEFGYRPHNIKYWYETGEDERPS